MSQVLLKKGISLFAVFAMVLSSFSEIAFAAAEEKIIIRNADQLISLAYSEDGGDFSKSYCLANDIDMSEASDKRPMKAIGNYSGGNGDIAFEGVFDGAGYKISNLSTAGEAFFGYIGENGKVENLTLLKASVHYSLNDSSKYPAALASLNKGVIENCFSVNSAVVSDYCSPAGGLVGTNFGTVRNCGVSGGSVTFAVSKSGTSHGGFVGNMRGGEIEQSFSTAIVDAKKWAGGFAGKIEDGVISDCYTLGNVTGTEETGGFAGALMSPAVVKNVYAANDITAKSGGSLIGGKGFSFASPGEVQNSYYSSDTLKPAADGGYLNDDLWAKDSEEIKSVDFAEKLSGNWTQNNSVNNGFPYLINAIPPAEATEQRLTVKVMIADYDSSEYEFSRLSGPFEISLLKSSATVKDVMDAAMENGLISYAFGINEQSTQIVTIDGVTLVTPDGWMFSVNGELSPVGANSAIISDGDELLWYVGTPENGYKAPDWNEVEDSLASDEYSIIATAEELVQLSENPDKWGENYRLSGNIDLSGREFSPIGSSEIPFTGIFDGRGFEISGLTIKKDRESRNIGLFGVIKGAKIKNVKITGADITGGSVVGGLVGFAGVNEENERAALIAECSVSGVVRAVGNSYIKQTDAGGLVGVNDAVENESGRVVSSAVDNCVADVSVTGNTGTADLSDAGHIGGLAGLNKGIVSNSRALGNVFGGNTTGGFVGSNYGGSIYNSEALGNVTGAYTVGGFAGSIGLYSLAENCYSKGDVLPSVDSASNLGGFAGAVSGRVKNCISSGTLTPGRSYNGGFAGNFDGSVWSYLEELRTISNCFGNVCTSDSKTVKALGNYIGGIHAPADTAAAEIGVDKDTAEKKIEEMLSQSGTENMLSAEADKYKNSSVIPATVKENSDVTALIAKLNTNTSADSAVKLSYRASGNAIKADENGYTLGQKPESGDCRETVTLTLEADGVSFEKYIAVTMLSKTNETDSTELLKNIAESYAADCSDYWKAIALCAYDEIFNTDFVSDDIKEKFVSQAVSSIKETDKDTTLAMNIIALRAMGFNPSDITLEDGSKINAYEILKNEKSSGNNGDAYRLLAYAQGKYTDKDDIEATIDRLLSARTDNKGWSNNEDEEIDPDTTGAVILGLSDYYKGNTKIKEAVDAAVLYLSSLMQNDGNIKSSYKESNYGTNANTSAICAIGLEAIGIDISSDERFTRNSASLYDGIMSFAAEDGFLYDYSDKKINDLATKQAVLAVMASEKNGRVFDFADNVGAAIDLEDTKEQGGSSSGGSSLSNAGTVNSKDGLNGEVYFTLVGDNVHGREAHEDYITWISSESVEISENSSVSDVIKSVLTGKNYEVEGLENGYVSGITTPDGISLGEYDNGKNSGWLYSVNDKAPSVGMNDYIVKDGDRIKLYYTDNWDETGFSDVASDDWFFDAVQYVSGSGLIVGNENGEFMPGETLTRAMLVTVLGRYSKADLSEYTKGNFEDVSADDWYGAYVFWAEDNGIAFGVGDGLFAPDKNITREQLAAMLYRYAVINGAAESEDTDAISAFSDADNVSDWAQEAMNWAVDKKLISGMGSNILAPGENATRAQFAVIIMKFSELV